MTSVHLACAAMATRFEFVLHGERESALRAAGEEAIAEVHRIEAELSAFRPESQIARLNREAGRHAVRVTPELLSLLQHACQLSQATRGAFDITVGPLLKAWGFRQPTGQVPSHEELAAATKCIGTDKIHFDPALHLVKFQHAGVSVDLGAIGKGYALDRAADLLREAEITSALLHGGTSTIVAVGSQPDGAPWRVALDPPTLLARTPAPSGNTELPATPFAVVELRDESLSVSAVWGKGFEVEGTYYGHVIDPRAGRPVTGAWLAALVLPSATESDALSTALLVDGVPLQETLRLHLPGARSLLVYPTAASPGFAVSANGITASTE
ncbi:MAG: FAD:protein FMN transferase [Verrucomicrobiales bacterium]|nr:FAD:protein FMN transferase [Verrucomicrobiales bacterium]